MKWTKSMTLDEKLWLTSANKLETQALLGQEVTVVDKKGLGESVSPWSANTSK